MKIFTPKVGSEIPASRMPKTAKVALCKAVYKGFVWTFKKRPGRGGVYIAISEAKP